ncbi:Cellulose binding domain-containing protein [Alteromonadaceae bacterium Bs31]|nr:Cellulose binding domain-containing protein [Alteromonadaceae bacterium Bs31]
MNVKTLLRTLILSLSTVILFSANAVLAQTNTVSITLEIDWEPVSGSADWELTEAMSSTTDTWVFGASLGDFDLSTQSSYPYGIYQALNQPVSFNVDSSTPVPAGLEPAQGHISIGSADYISNEQNDGISPVKLSDRTLGVTNYQPGYGWFFERTLYLPQGNDTDESILAALATAGAEFDVEELFFSDHIAIIRRNGIARVSAVNAAPALCEIVVHSQWSDGYVADIRIRNESTQAIEGWSLDLALPDSATISNYWNSEISGAGPFFTAINAAWNGSILPGQQVSFGINGPIATQAHSISDARISGAICQ